MFEQDIPYRVFISYSHEDRDVVEKIDEVLKANGLKPWWDKDFQIGDGFPEQIRMFIAHAHVFLPVMTASSAARGWVHQEIGYAMAHNVPVLPVVVGDALPGQMMQQLLAVRVERDLAGLEQGLSRTTIADLVNRYKDPAFALFQCARAPEERAKMLGEYARTIEGLKEYGPVRQKGALSSFHLPDKRASHPIWQKRYGPVTRSEYLSELLRKERLALEAHAREKGCRLVIDPYLNYSQYGAAARKIRLETLVEFLKSDRVAHVEVAVWRGMPVGDHVTIVGDWFYAGAVAASQGKGYRQTIFTRHAPSMRGYIKEFDTDFKELLDEAGWTPESSREEAIELLKSLIAEIKLD